MTELIVGLVLGAIAGASVTALAFRFAIEELARRAVADARDEAGESRGYEDPRQDWPRG